VTADNESGTLEVIRERVDLNRRAHIFRTLETARRTLCAYAQDPCDCKYGLQLDLRPGSEATGCCELRQLIREWTGWFPFNRGQTVEDMLAALIEHEYENRPWLRPENP
jgi:hypothetical protein